MDSAVERRQPQELRVRQARQLPKVQHGAAGMRLRFQQYLQGISYRAPSIGPYLLARHLKYWPLV